MSAPTEPVWKRWLDRLLMVNVLLVFIGAGVFAVAVVQQGQGPNTPRPHHWRQAAATGFILSLRRVFVLYCWI